MLYEVITQNERCMIDYQRESRITSYNVCYTKLLRVAEIFFQIGIRFFFIALEASAGVCDG